MSWVRGTAGAFVIVFILYAPVGGTRIRSGRGRPHALPFGPFPCDGPGDMSSLNGRPAIIPRLSARSPCMRVTGARSTCPRGANWRPVGEKDILGRQQLSSRVAVNSRIAKTEYCERLGLLVQRRTHTVPTDFRCSGAASLRSVCGRFRLWGCWRSAGGVLG